MAERRSRYPLLRGRRPIERRLWRWFRRLRRLPPLAIAWRIAVMAGIVAAVVVAAIALRRAMAPDAASETAKSRAALARGAYGAACDHARAAVASDPDRAEAHAALARALLAQGDGEAAEAAAQGALAAGYPAHRARVLAAAAYRLEGDAARALAAASAPDPADAVDAARVRARALADRGDTGAAQAVLVAVLARPPRDPAVAGAIWADIGRIRFAGGDIAGAGEAAERAARMAPGHLDGIVLAGEVARTRYGPVASLPWFAAALRRDPAYHAALIEQAATLGDLGRYRAMLVATRAALAARPGSPQALYLEAVMAARAGQFDLARALMDRTEGRIAAMPGALLLTGALDYAQGRPQEAIEAWDALLARQPLNLTVRRLLGAARLRAGDPRGALAVLRPIALRADADPYTLTLAARAFERVGERDWAARLLDRAARPPAGGAAPFGADEALPALALAAARAPGDPAAATAYLRGLIEAGRMDAAIARARSMAAAAPGAPEAQTLAGDTLIAAGRPAAAVAPYALAANLDFGAPALLRLIEAATGAGMPRKAAEALALYLSQNPQSMVARRILGNLELDSGDGAAAWGTLEGLRRALGDRDAAILTGLARASLRSGDGAAALRHARRAAALAPMNAAAADAYARALRATGSNAAALQLADKAAALAPGDPAIRRLRARLLAETGATKKALRRAP